MKQHQETGTTQENPANEMEDTKINRNEVIFEKNVGTLFMDEESDNF